MLAINPVILTRSGERAAFSASIAIMTKVTNKSSPSRSDFYRGGQREVE